MDTMNTYSTSRWYTGGQDNNEGLQRSLLSWEIVPWGVWVRGVPLTFPGYVIIDEKRQ